MNHAEAALVLAKAASYDNRTVSVEQAVAWSQALPGVVLSDALEAVIGHYRETRVWVMPDDVRRRVALVRAQRLATLPEPAFPPELEGREYAAAVAEWRRQVGNGQRPTVQAVLDVIQRPALSASPATTERA